MRIKQSLAVPFLIGLLQGCAHRDPFELTKRVTTRHVVLTPNLVDQLRTRDQVSQYRVAAYIDPADPRLLHDAHYVYELRQDSEWIIDDTSWTTSNIVTSESPQ